MWKQGKSARRRGGARLAAVFWLGWPTACADQAEVASETGAAATAATEGGASTTADPSQGDALPTDPDPPTSTTTAVGSGTDPADGASTSASADESGGDPRDGNGCPAAAPGAWIACEDFDLVTDAPTQLSQWNVNGDGFAVEPGIGVQGSRALRVRLQPGVMFGGWVTLRFGEGPAAPAVDSPDGRWDELWMRYRVRTEPGWPGRAIGDVGELIAMNGADWAIAADLNLHAEDTLRIRARGWSCVFDGTLGCDGTNDWTGVLQNIWSDEGPTVIFDAAHADTWQCIEAHLRLNTPGLADGQAHVWVDGVAQIEQSGLDWRGTWDAFGINAVRFTNYADPVEQPLDFAVDDLVVGTARVGCEPIE